MPVHASSKPSSENSNSKEKEISLYRQRQIIALSKVLGLEPEVISKDLGIPLETVRYTINNPPLEELERDARRKRNRRTGSNAKDKEHIHRPRATITENPSISGQEIKEQLSRSARRRPKKRAGHKKRQKR